MVSKTKTPRPGSRKSLVRELFEKSGAEAAHAAGRRRKLKESTLRTWFSTWSHNTKVGKAAHVGR